ncbi:hypothetical protein SLEP1_g19103 [Rubroshorea leprosula]|nr:hypothetical protein SLEP1_g19103 [Rubroshorea leprosula]
MEKVATHANVIVPEVLRGGNYKSQLPAGGNMSSDWMKKNALALHAIMISCGEEIFNKIKEKDSAKDVWDALADMHKPPVAHKEIVEHPPQRQTGPGNLVSSEYEILTKAISSGALSKVKKFFRENSNAKSARISENGYTALHFAVYNGQKEIVDYLTKYKWSKEDLETQDDSAKEDLETQYDSANKDLETQDDSGSTALSIAARYGIRKSIAKKLVRKNKNLLIIL